MYIHGKGGVKRVLPLRTGNVPKRLLRGQANVNLEQNHKINKINKEEVVHK
jgi:hypothetical protein